MPRLLLVEDNELNRDMLSRRLERKGYEVVIAIDGVTSRPRDSQEIERIAIGENHRPSQYRPGRPLRGDQRRARAD